MEAHTQRQQARLAREGVGIHTLWPIALLAVVMAGAIILLALAVQSEKRPVLAESQWINTDNFLRQYPDRLNSHLSQGFMEQGAALFVNIGSGPEWRTKVGRIESEPFDLARHMAIPLRGWVYSVAVPSAITFNPTGGSVSLVCIGSGQSIALLNSPSQDWFERTISIPKYWCRTQAKLVAEVSDPNISVGVGTPYAVNWAYALVGSNAGWIVAFGVVSAIFLLLFLPILLLVELSWLVRTSLALLVLGGAGYLSFIVQAINLPQNVIWPLYLALLLLPTLGSVTLALRRNPDEAQRLVFAQERLALLSCMALAWLLVGLFYVVPILLTPIHSGSWTANYAFYPVSWSTDNQLPLGMARYVIETDFVQSPGMGAWSVTDRGFIPSGLMVLVFTLLDMVGLERQNPISYLMGQNVIAFANASVLLLLVHLPSIARQSRWTMLAAAAVILSTPFFFFNTVYTWPKLAAGTYAIWAVFALVAGLGNRGGLLLLAPILFAMGLLFHSATLFVLPPLIAYTAWQAFRLQRIGTLGVSPTGVVCLVAGIVAAVAIVAGHNAFGAQSSFGMTFVLMGSGIFGLSSSELIATLLKFYGEMSPARYLAVKWDQIITVFWPAVGFAGDFDYESSILARLRMAGFFSVLPAFSLFPLLILLVPQWRTRPVPQDQRLLSGAAIIGSLTAGSLLIISAFPFLVHHLPYAFMLSVVMWSTLRANFELPTVRVLAGLHVGIFVLVWPIGTWWIWSSHFPSGSP